jgi:hypothetical protein
VHPDSGAADAGARVVSVETAAHLAAALAGNNAAHVASVARSPPCTTMACAVFAPPLPPPPPETQATVAQKAA